MYIFLHLGALTATGSMVAFGKLNGNIASAPIKLPGGNLINLVLFSICILSSLQIAYPQQIDFLSLFSDISGIDYLLGITVLSGILGLLLTSAVGGLLFIDINILIIYQYVL